MALYDQLLAQATTPSQTGSATDKLALVASIVQRQQQKDKQPGHRPGPSGHRPGGGGHVGNQTDRFLNTARKQVGDPYEWGHEGPNGFDCSGLVNYSLEKAGVKLPARLSAAGFQRWTHPVSKKHLKPGDLVYFNYGRLGGGVADHVGIYKGHGRMIAASSSADRVQVQPVDWSAFIGGGEVRHLR